MNKKIIIAAAGLLVLVLAAIGGWTFSGAGNTICYTQIDNDKIEPGGENGGVVDFKGNMAYYYTLTAYDASGSPTEITFGTSRELRQSAFLQLTTAPVRGVIKWSEISWQDLPAPVQAHYQAPEND